MMNNPIFSIGVMSGTSLDGVDLVYVSLDNDDYRNFEIIHSKTIPYSKKWKQELQTAIFKSKEDLGKLDVIYGVYLGNLIQVFIEEYQIKSIDFIASHGHTILHQPDEGITFQIGNGKEIAEITQQKVVYDFRTQDVQLGGQGAPLVPIGDELLFSDYDFCLNLGGFSNISFKKNGQRIAYDVSPVNIVLNHYANKLGLLYDDSGRIASKGKVNPDLLEKLNALEFYTKEPPKSLGLEWVQTHVFPLIDGLEKDIPIILRTFVEHIAIQIGKVIYKNEKILVTGGGAFNAFLIERLAYRAGTKINLPDQKLINFKEALLFSFLGFLKLKNEINCLKSVTGACKNHSSGVVVTPSFLK